jgi:hypothetical protein
MRVRKILFVIGNGTLFSVACLSSLSTDMRLRLLAFSLFLIGLSMGNKIGNP